MDWRIGNAHLRCLSAVEYAVRSGPRNRHEVCRVVALLGIFNFFFFSSRRRHTRSLCDWSSDVCSSDLSMTPAQLVQSVLLGGGLTATNITYSGAATAIGSFNGTASNIGFNAGVIMASGEIGRASCRERV